MTTDNTDNSVAKVDKTEDIEPAVVVDGETGEVKFTQADMDSAIQSRVSRESKNVKALEDKVAELEAQLDIEEDGVEGADVDVVDTEKEDLKAQIEKLEGQYKQERLDNAIKLELTKANARNMKAVMALLDVDAIEETEEGDFTGISEAIEQLQESDSYLFDIEATTRKSSAGGNPRRRDMKQPSAFDNVFGQFKQ